MSTYRNVKAQIAKLEKQAADLFKREVNAVLEKVRGLITEYGLTAADLGFAGKASKVVKATRTRKTAGAKKVGVPMYQDPASGKTWTGRGKPPNFIIEGIKSGKSKSDFLISKSATVTATAAKVAKRAKPVKVSKVAKKAAPAPRPAKKAVSKTRSKATAKKRAATPTVAKTDGAAA